METTIISINGQNYTLTDSYNEGDIATIEYSDYAYIFSGAQDSLDAVEDIIMEQPDAVMLYADNGACIVFSNYEIEERDLAQIEDDYEAEWVDFAGRKSGACGVYGD